MLLSGALSAGHAEIVLPSGTTLQGAMTLSGDNPVHATRIGSNLLHTVSVFNVLTGESVTYTPPTTGGAVSDVMTRVSGAQSSLIQGTINGIPGARFWFINPNGISFASGAVLNGASMFHFSTAHYIKLADGAIISANPLQGGALTVAAPSDFGFLTANPAPISVGNTTGTILRPRTPGATTTNPDGTLSLVGGTVHIGPPAGMPGATGPGFIHAHSRLNLVSVASAGEARFDGRGFNVDTFAQLGDVNIKQGSVVDSKEVFIRAGRLTLDNGAIVPWVFRSLLPQQQPQLSQLLNGGEVNVRVSNEMTVRGTATPAGGAPNLGFPAGIYTFSVPVNSEISLSRPMAVPDINIQAGSVSVSGAGNTPVVVANIRSERFAPGSGADVVINTGALEIRDGAVVAVNNFFGLPVGVAPPSGETPGTLTVNAGHVELSAGPGVTRFTGIGGQSDFAANNLYSAAATTNPALFFRRDPRLTNAEGANVTINATGSLIVRGGAEISTDSFSLGRAGDINIQARDILLSRDGAATGVIASQSLFAGASGNLNIDATGRIVMSGGFEISATTGGTGDGGRVNVSAGEFIGLDGVNTGIFSRTVLPPENRLNAFAVRMGQPTYAALRAAHNVPASGDLSDVLAALNSFRPAGVGPTLISIPDLTLGDSGNVTIAAPRLTMSNGARIDNSTAWAGNAGEINVNVGSASVNSGAQVRSQSGLVRSSTGLLEVGSGNAGKVTINASDLSTITLSGPGSAISTSTFGAGAGGAIQLTSAGDVRISDGASITADSFGTGITGDISITAGNSIMMDNGTISTSARTSDGGNIKLTAPLTVQLTGSRITTSVESGTGGGGNISIDPEFVILKGSSITANAFGGPGGNVTIVANTFLSDAFTVVEASSALSTPGTVQILSPDNNVASDIAQLPGELVDASRLLQGACSARRAGAASSFTLAGRGGVPVDPDGYLPSFVAIGGPSDGVSSAGAGQGLALATAGWDCWR